MAENTGNEEAATVHLPCCALRGRSPKCDFFFLQCGGVGRKRNQTECTGSRLAPLVYLAARHGPVRLVVNASAVGHIDYAITELLFMPSCGAKTLGGNTPGRTT